MEQSTAEGKQTSWSNWWLATRDLEANLQREIRRGKGHWLRTTTSPGSLKWWPHYAEKRERRPRGKCVQPQHHQLSSKACIVQWPGEGQVTSSCRGQSASQASVPGKSIREAARPWDSKLQEPPVLPNPRLGSWWTLVRIHICEKPSPALTSQPRYICRSKLPPVWGLGQLPLQHHPHRSSIGVLQAATRLLSSPLSASHPQGQLQGLLAKGAVAL